MATARERYYLKHRDQITTKMRERYDSEAAAAYYECNRERIRDRQKSYYNKKAEGEHIARLQNLIPIADPLYHPFLQSLICQVAALTAQDITGVEKSILMAGKITKPVEKAESD